jgi:hypothetical protein
MPNISPKAATPSMRNYSVHTVRDASSVMMTDKWMSSRGTSITSKLTFSQNNI